MAGNEERKTKIRVCGQNHDVVQRHLLKSSAAKYLVNEDQIYDLEISTPMYMCWAERKKPRLEYAQLYNACYEIRKEKKQGYQILVCWKTKRDEINALTSYQRSVNFIEIMSTYEEWEASAQRGNIRIIDISEYTKKEIEIIKRRYSFWSEQKNKIKDTVEIIKTSKHIVSVDTSLIHISATCGRRVKALMPKYNDERWRELLNNKGVYKENVEIYQQLKYNRWKEIIETIKEDIYCKDDLNLE